MRLLASASGQLSSRWFVPPWGTSRAWLCPPWGTRCMVPFRRSLRTAILRSRLAGMTPENGPERPQLPLRWPAGEPGGQAVSRAEPTRSAPGPGTPAPSRAAPAVEGQVTTTIRLRPAAAAALNSTWLYQRMHVNPRLSYPEFASEIVRLGLAAFERQAKRPLPAVARAGSIRDDHGRIPRPGPSGADLASASGQPSPRSVCPPWGDKLALSPMGDIGGRPAGPPRALAAEPGDNPLYHPFPGAVGAGEAWLWMISRFAVPSKIRTGSQCVRLRIPQRDNLPRAHEDHLTAEMPSH